MRPRHFVLGFLLAVAAAGCGDGPKLGQVTGTVKHKGELIPAGTITFHPDKGRPAVGTIKDGAIVDVTTVTRGDGAPVGKVRVTVQPESGGDMYAKRKATIPDKYGNPEKSGLTAEIKADGSEVNINLD